MFDSSKNWNKMLLSALVERFFVSRIWDFGFRNDLGLFCVFAIPRPLPRMSPWAATSAAFISACGRSCRHSAASSPGTCSRGSHAPHRLEEGALGYSKSKPNRQDAYFVPPPPSTGGPPAVSSLRPSVTPPPVTRGRRAAPLPRACSWPGAAPPSPLSGWKGGYWLALPAWAWRGMNTDTSQPHPSLIVQTSFRVHISVPKLQACLWPKEKRSSLRKVSESQLC